jgi:hypothetical protein
MRNEYDFHNGIRGKYAKQFAEGTNLESGAMSKAFEEIGAGLNDAIAHARGH